MIQSFETQWGGKTLSIEVGRYAGQANASCTVRYGDTVVLGTCVLSHAKREGIDFFPLVTDYEEKLYAAGKIKGSRFIKREGRPSDEAILTSRMIDRSIRPLFDDRLRNDVQVITTVLSVDMENDSDIPALVAASSVLMLSDIPWQGPIAGIRVGRLPSEDPAKEPEWVINPSFSAREKSQLDLIVAGTPERVIMIEAGANEVDEGVMEEAIRFAQKHLGEVITLIGEVADVAGKAKRPVFLATTDEEMQAQAEKEALLTEAKQFLAPKIREAFFGAPRASKDERRAAREQLTKELENYLIGKNIGKDKRLAALNAVRNFIEAEVSRAILEEERRVDGRGLTELRPLTVEVGILPRTHGSGHFSRGETQVLSTVTLGSPSMVQTLEGMEVSGKKSYMHHYNFPPFSVGEVAPLRGPGRREIGHGALAERALLPVLPDKNQFPYTIRVVSEVLSSNGSSSMASSCGSTLALMDAGVPILAPVAGIAMGLAFDESSGAFKVLTDLQDLEDGQGGMDFKITGTQKGITAIQMDTKTKGLTPSIVSQTFKQAKEGRLQILETMTKVIPAPRPELSPYAPRIISLQINPERIRDVIGPGGKVINEIIEKTGVEIDIEQSGLVMITSVSAEAAQKAMEWVRNLTREVKAGEEFQGKVSRIMDFGAFVEILPNQEGLVHISELAPFHVRAVRDIVQVGEIIPVKVIEIDSMGRLNLSLKQAPGYSLEKYGKGAEKFADERPPHRGPFRDRRPPGRKSSY
ncbi:polyribonucleotide nucleotidyltransferase [Candidatus Uhrbacteria bacterium]|nr:polyribonucleotide nucleotidyltransferase [Candidatus Uhrbacteria bacterium]